MRIQIFTFLLTLCSLGAYGQFTNGTSVTVTDGAVLYSGGDIHNTTGSKMQINGTTALAGNFVNDGDVTSGADGTVQFMGAGSSEMTPGTGNYANISMDKQGTAGAKADVTLKGNLTIDKMLDFTDGAHTRMVIGANNLVMAAAATTLAAAATRYVVTNGVGVMEQRLSTMTAGYPAAVNHPVGDMDNYSPISSNITGTTLGSTAALSVNVKAVKHPDLLTTSTDYINRYWNVKASDVTGYSNVLNGTYVDGASGVDVVGTEGSMVGSYRATTGSASWQFTSAGSNASNNTLNATTNLLNVDFTGQNLKLQTDLKPNLTVYSPAVNGSTQMLLTVEARELNGSASAGSTSIRLIKSNFLSFTYDGTATNLAGVSVNNSAWTFNAGHPVYWVWTTNSVVGASGTSPKFGVLATFNSSGAKGSQNFQIQIPENSGGDTNLTNNTDFETITYQ